VRKQSDMLNSVYDTREAVLYLIYAHMYYFMFYYNCDDTNNFHCEDQSLSLCKWEWVSSWIINELDKH